MHRTDSTGLQKMFDVSEIGRRWEVGVVISNLGMCLMRVVGENRSRVKTCNEQDRNRAADYLS